MSCKQLMLSRARQIAAAYDMDPRRACQSLTPIGVNGSIAAGADGVSYDAAINDPLSPVPIIGDHLNFKTKGSQKYLVLGLISGLKDDTAVGYRGFRWNGNDVKNNFESSFEVDAPGQVFWNVEAVRAGIEAFPWDCLPAFGPNDNVQIGLWNTTGAPVAIPILGYAMPVPDSYKPAVGKLQ